MTHLLRRTAAAFLGAAVLAVTLADLTAGEASADPACTVTGFSPRSVSLGLTPVPVRFRPTVIGCTPQGWSLEGGDFTFYATDVTPENTFAPLSNSEAAPADVVVSAYGSDHEEHVQSFQDGFVLKRGTVWDQFNASPEPVKKGAKITIKGRLRLADWEKGAYLGYTSQTVGVQFRTATGSYRAVATARTGPGGYLTTTVTAAGDGYWRLRYGGNSTAGASVVAGDFVDVR